MFATRVTLPSSVFPSRTRLLRGTAAMGSTFHSNVRSAVTVSSIIFLMSGLASVKAMAPAACGEKRKRAAPVIRQYSDSVGFAFASASSISCVCLSLGPGAEGFTYICNWGDSYLYPCYTHPRLKGIPHVVGTQLWKSLTNALSPRGMNYSWSGVVE